MNPPAPQIFLHQDQVDRLWQQFVTDRQCRQWRALGMELDGGEVFHVYTEPPSTHFAGSPCVAIVELREAATDANEISELGPRDGTRLVVLLTVAGGRIHGRGFVQRDDGWVQGEVRIVPVRTDLLRRSAGLLETDALARRSVAVVGLGSGGSTIAVALAQAGVGRLVLIDRDRMEVGNVSRHACGIGDLGRRKTQAVRDLALGRNPVLDVVSHDIDVLLDQDSLRAALSTVDVVVAATDSDASRFLLNQVALDLKVTTVFGRVLARAVGGDVLRVRPGRGPCLACVYNKQFLEQRPREYASMAAAREDAEAYMSEEDIAAKVQVGLASDIAPVANFVTKLVLVELSRGTQGGLEALDADLSADFYLWANRREGLYASWTQMGFSFDKPAILRWYGGNIPRRPDCGACGTPAATVPTFFGD